MLVMAMVSKQIVPFTCTNILNYTLFVYCFVRVIIMRYNNNGAKEMRIIIFIIGTLSLINVILLPLVANPTIGFVMQAVISVCLILYALFFRRIPKKIHVFAGILCLIPVVFALFLGIYGNVSNADYSEDAVIVLGAGVNVETVSKPLARRLDAAIEYWNQNTDSRIVVCGGLGNRAIITEAEAMARYLTARGVPGEVILLEDQSTLL